MDDNTPLRQFVEAGSQEAFRELVGRHTDLVYACAMQRLRDAHAAQDVTQAVFLTLALKAKDLRSHTSLAGWLFTTTRYVATRYQRGEQRRKEREMRAFEETQIADSGTATEAAWEHMQPHLAGALDSLSGADREAVLLRFYRKASHQEVATALGTSEDGARKRVDRALNKLRRFITNKGVALSATALAGALTANAAQAAPAGLAATAGATALAGAGGTLTTTSTLVLAKGAIQMMFIAQLKTAALITAACVVVAGSGVIVAKEVLTPPATPVSAQAEPKGLPPPTPATNDTATIAWGAVTNELQAGLVPLGGVKGWERPLCPDHTNGIANGSMLAETAVKKRCCRVCEAPKPWSATFIEDEPMRMELHFRNLAKEVVNLYDARHGGHWQFIFTPVGGGAPLEAYWGVKDARTAESFVTISLGIGEQDAVDLELGSGWAFRGPKGLRPAPRVSAGKYTVTATYGHFRPENNQAKTCTYWRGTVTTGPVEIEIKPDDATARFLDAAKYAGFAAVAEVKTLPQAGDKTKPAQLGIEWKELLYAPEIARNELSDVRALELKDGQTTDKLQPGDRILVTVDQQQVMILALSKRLDKSSVNGAKWISWSQNRQDALQAALAPGWRKGACPWCHRGADSDYPVCACRNGCEGKGCTQRQKQRGGCIVTAKGGGFCERTVGPATRDVTFRLWVFDPKAHELKDIDLKPFHFECRIKAGAGTLPLWVQVKNEKGETPEFQTPVGGAGFDYCKTLFYMVEGPGLTAPTPAFHADADGGALANIRGAAALKKGSACGQVQLVAGDLFGKPIVSTPMGEGTKIVQPVVGKLFATPGTYTVRAVAGRLVSNPVKVEVCVGAFLSLQGESMRKELTNEEAHQLAVRLANEKFAKKAFIDPMTGNKMPAMSIDLPPGEKTNNRWLFLRSAPAGIFAKVSFDLDGSNPVVEVDYARE